MSAIHAAGLPRGGLVAAVLAGGTREHHGTLGVPAHTALGARTRARASSRICDRAFLALNARAHA